MNTQQLLVVIPYHNGDLDQTRKLLAWIKEISPKLAPHCCVMAADSVIPHETKVELANIARDIFYYAEGAIINVPSDRTGWPRACNAMFETAAQHVQECFKLPWFWMEPDCIPLRDSWLDELAVHYARCPKRYMGALIKSNQPPLPPVHLAGCAVYPADAWTMMQQFTQGDLAWDIANAPYVVPRAMHTSLIGHHWGEAKLPPTFKEAKAPGDSINTCTLSFIPDVCAVFHRCKDGTLIDVLRKKRHTAAEIPAAEPKDAAPETPGKRGPGRPRKEPAPVPA